MEIVAYDGVPVVVSGLSAVLVGRCGITSVREATEDESPDPDNIYIVEADSLGRGGLPVIARLQSASPRVRIIVYTMHNEEWLMKQVIAMGVDGAVLKSEPLEALIGVVEAVAAGNRSFSPAFRKVHAAGDCEAVAALSGRESQVLSMLAKGMTSSRIASELCLSINTVQTYRQRIMEKFGVANVAELVFQTKGLV